MSDNVILFHFGTCFSFEHPPLIYNYFLTKKQKVLSQCFGAKRQHFSSINFHFVIKKIKTLKK